MSSQEEHDGLPDWAIRATASMERAVEVLAGVLDKTITVAIGALALASAQDIMLNQPNLLNATSLGACALLTARQVLNS